MSSHHHHHHRAVNALLDSAREIARERLAEEPVARPRTGDAVSPTDVRIAESVLRSVGMHNAADELAQRVVDDLWLEAAYGDLDAVVQSVRRATTTTAPRQSPPRKRRRELPPPPPSPSSPALRLRPRAARVVKKEEEEYSWADDSEEEDAATSDGDDEYEEEEEEEEIDDDDDDAPADDDEEEEIDDDVPAATGGEASHGDWNAGSDAETDAEEWNGMVERVRPLLRDVMTRALALRLHRRSEPPVDAAAQWAQFVALMPGRVRPWTTARKTCTVLAIHNMAVDLKEHARAKQILVVTRRQNRLHHRLCLDIVNDVVAQYVSYTYPETMYVDNYLPAAVALS